jgi:hypothetical protein
MNKFPEYLIPEKRKDFTELYERRELSFLRKKILKYLLSGDTSGFSFENKKLIEKLIPELNNLGWKTKFAYGDTVLLIYENENEIPQQVKDLEFI